MLRRWYMEAVLVPSRVTGRAEGGWKSGDEGVWDACGRLSSGEVQALRRARGSARRDRRCTCMGTTYDLLMTPELPWASGARDRLRSSRLRAHVSRFFSRTRTRIGHRTSSPATRPSLFRIYNFSIYKCFPTTQRLLHHHHHHRLHTTTTTHPHRYLFCFGPLRLRRWTLPFLSGAALLCSAAALPRISCYTAVAPSLGVRRVTVFLTSPPNIAHGHTARSQGRAMSCGPAAAAAAAVIVRLVVVVAVRFCYICLASCIVSFLPPPLFLGSYIHTT